MSKTETNSERADSGVRSHDLRFTNGAPPPSDAPLHSAPVLTTWQELAPGSQPGHNGKCRARGSVYRRRDSSHLWLTYYDEAGERRACATDFVAGQEEQARELLRALNQGKVLAGRPRNPDRRQLSTLPARLRPPPGLELVYFVGSSYGPTKVGFTSKLDERLRSIRTNCPGRIGLVAWVEGGFEVEHHIHLRARRLRECGEWFRLADDDPRKLIANVLETFGKRRHGVAP